MAETGAIDSLFIDIGADDSGATQKLDKLVESLRGLSAAVSSLSGLKKVSDSLSQITTDLNNSKEGLKALSASINAIARLSTVGEGTISDEFIGQIKKLSEVSKDGEKGLKALGNGLRAIAAYGKVYSQFGIVIPDNFIKSIGKISDISENAQGGLKALSSALRSIEKVSNVELSSNIATSLQKISDVSSSLKNPEMLTALANSIEKIGASISSVNLSSVTEFANSLQALNNIKEIKLQANLADEISKLAQAVNSLTPLSGEAILKISDAVEKFSSIKKIGLKGFAREFRQIPLMAKALQQVDLTAFADQIQRLADALTPLAEKLKVVAAGAKALGGKLPKLPEQEQPPKEEGKPKTGLLDFIDSIKGIDSVSSAFEKLRGIVSQTSGPVGALKDSINKVAPGLSELATGAKDVVKTGLDTYAESGSVAMTALAVSIEAAKTAVKAFVAEARSLVSPLISGFQSLGKTISSNLLKTLKQLPKALSGISSFIKSSFKNVGSLFIKEFTGPITSAIKQIKTWKNAIGRIAYYRTVRSAIKLVTDGFKTGMENLYQYSRLVGTEFAPSMDKLATSALYLKNSLGAIAAPLINAIAPVVDILIDKFVALLNIIGKVFAALTGKSVYSQAKKHATEYADAANAASKATKSFLLGIDELNVIEESAAGGAGLADDFGNMFEEVEVGEEFDWARQIREAIENGEWQEAGTILAEKLNEVVSAWDTYSWGEKLGEKINNGLNFAYGFMSNFGFRELGQKFGDMVLGLIDGIGLDGFELLGRTLASKWNALFDIIAGILDEWEPRVADMGASIAAAINGWFDEIHWDEIAQTISRGIVFLANLVTETFKNIEWADIGESFAEFFNNIDWYEIITSVADAIIEGFNGLKKAIDAFLAKWDWKETATQIFNSINDSLKKIDAKGCGETIGNALKTALHFVIDVISGINWREVGEKIAEFIIGLDWVEILAGLANVIMVGINAAIEALIGLISTIQPHIKEWAHKLAEYFMDFVRGINWADMGKAISDGIEAALDFMIEFMQTVDWEEVGEHIMEFFNNIDWDTLLTKWGQLMGEFINAKMKLIDVSGVIELAGNIISGLIKGITEKYSSLGFFGFLKMVFIDWIVGGIKNLLGIHSPSTVFAEIAGNMIAGLYQGLSEAWESIISFFTGAFEGISNLFSSGWEILKALTRGDFQEIYDIISGAWTQTEDDTREKWSRISSETNTTWNDLRDKSKENFEGIHQNIAEQWDQTKEKTQTVWDETSIHLQNTWSNLETESDTAFGNIRDTIHVRWTETDSQTKQSWDDIQRGLNEKYSAINSDTDSGFENVKNTVKLKHEEINTDIENSWEEAKNKTKYKLSELKTVADTEMDDFVSKAKRWGEDISKNIADGIESKMSRVTSSINTLAENIRSRIHFSEPDIGPLSDFHTYMPDMMESLAKGIRDNEHLAISAVDDLAGNLAKSFTNISNKELEFPVHENAYVQYAEKAADDSVMNSRISNANNETNGDFETTLKNANNDVVSALYAIAGEIVGAVQDLENRPVSVNISRQELVREVERGQRERGANILRGGVMG